MKKLLFALAILLTPLLAPSDALAQCNGIFQNNTICGNITGGPAVPRPVPNSALTGVPGGTNGQVQYNNSGVFGGVTATCPAGQVLQSISSVAVCVAAKITLAAPTTFYVATTGVDAVGCGVLIGNPCHTAQYVYSILSGYDLNGNVVTVKFADGVYTDYIQVRGSILQGQAGPSGLVFQGDCADPHQVVFQPTANAPAFAFFFGASAQLTCMKVDGTAQFGYPAPSDLLQACCGSQLYVGDGSLFSVRADMVYGCNYYSGNAFTITQGSSLTILNDFEIDVSACQKQTTGTVTLNSTVVTGLVSTTGVRGQMNVIGTNLPTDAYVQCVGTLSGATCVPDATKVTFACVYSSTTCKSSGTATETITFTGGGQTFIDLYDHASLVVNTNGDPSYSILGTLSNFPFYVNAFMNVGLGSGANPQAMTFVNPEQGRGACLIIKQGSAIDTNFQGIPYLPCNTQAAVVSQTSVSLVAGATSFTVSSATGIYPGMIVTDVAQTTATWVAGDASVVVGSATGIVAGAKVTAPGILAGTVAGTPSGTTIPVAGCSNLNGAQNRCVSGNPTYLSETATGIFFKNNYMSGASVVTSVSGTTVNISDIIVGTGTATLWFQGNKGGVQSVSGYSVYN